MFLQWQHPNVKSGIHTMKTTRPRAANTPGLLPILLGMLVAVSLSACDSSAQEGGAMAPRGPTEVEAITVEARDIPLQMRYAARVRAAREVEIRPRVGGILLKRNYQEGARVEAGESLFSIDPAPFRIAVASAEAGVAAAQARLARATREAKRLRPVVKARAASQQALDNALSDRKVAAADVAAAKARLREAKLNLEYTRVESPISGIAGRAQPSEGTLLAGPEVLLTTVTQSDPVHVLFGISDTRLLQLQRDASAGRLRLPEGNRFEATLRLADGSDYETAGSMDFSDVRVDPATGTSEARAVVANPDGLLRSGQFVSVRLQGAVRPAAIEIPQRAVLEGPQGKFVYVIADGKATPRQVKVGEWHGDAVLIREGLATGDRVIVDGLLKIGPGAPVQAAAKKED